jgi:CheY-like chemotaxis protein/anti-sigma regulatory factor (Ser/Thr protein kinase)
MVEQVVDLTRARWGHVSPGQDVQIALRTELGAGLPAILGVESEIREALTNLVFNAVDAMPDGGTLTLRTRSVAGAPPGPAAGELRLVEVTVADTGIGMDEATRQRCLEPFFTTKGAQGTGLGLAMVYGVMQRHGASLEIESVPGAGTSVSLLFGVPPAAPPGQPGAPDEPSAPPRMRILLVDDDPMLLHPLRDVLEGDGHVIVIAHSGQEGLAAFQAAARQGEPFAVVITDLGMPVMSGRQVARAIKEASPVTPVILLTGWGERLVAEGDIPPNVDRILSKPPRLRELREALAQCARLANG